MSNTTTSVSFALRVIGTNELVRYSVRDTSDGDHCGPTATKLEAGKFAEELPVYTRATLQEIAEVLQEDTPWYNSSLTTPDHGELQAEDLEIVERTIVETQVVQVFIAPPKLELCYQGRKPGVLLRRYCQMPELDGSLQELAVFKLPAGETVESMKRFVRNTVFKHGAFSRTVLAVVFEVPEDYAYHLSGEPGFCAVTTSDVSFATQSSPGAQTTS